MTWTRKQPKQPGYYWFKSEMTAPVILLIKRLENSKSELWVANSRIWIELPRGQWAGPIKEPSK